MQNPEKALPSYLTNLINRFQNLKSLRRQYKIILEWRSPRSKREAIDLGSYFYLLTIYSISRTVLVELSALLSEDEERSIPDWLRKAHQAAPRLKPTRYSRDYSGGDREPVSAKTLRGIIDKHLAELDSHADTISNIKSRRDKAIAHLDKRYFDDPKALYRDFPLTDVEVDELIDLVEQILRRHHSLIFGHDLSMDIGSSSNADVVLRYSRAFARVRKDRDLIIDKGFRPGDYTRD